MKGFIFLPLFITLTISVYKINCHRASAIDSLRLEFFELEKDIWDNVLDSSILNPVNPNSVKRGGIQVIRKFKEFDCKLKETFPHRLEYGLEFLKKLWAWEVLRTYELSNVYNFYETFRRVYLRQSENENSLSAEETWEKFSQSKVQDFQYKGVISLGNRIQEVSANDQLFENALKEANSDLCNLRQSPQQLLYNLYTTLALTELKGYAMMQFSYMLMQLYDKGNITREVELMKKGFEERSGRIIEVVQKVMQNASRDLWICDPKKHIKGETYEEITELLQGFIVNEVDLNSEGTCRKDCRHYEYTEVHGCFKNLYCAQQRACKGKIVNCQYFDADMWICPSNLYSGRRYEYIEYKKGRILGKKEHCSNGTTKVNSWRRGVFWRCSYCFCLCDEDNVEQGHNSDRYFSMRNVVADIQNNRVVTGLRLTKVNRIIHLQIQQGQLLPKGRINEDTLEWVPVDSFSVTDKGVYNGQDYHTLTWESRAIDLDDLMGQPNQVLTGVRFRKIGTHLHFEIQVNPFNFSSGLLTDPKNKNVWISNDNTEGSHGNNRRTEFRINKPDVPILSKNLSVPDSHSNQFLHFTNTDVDKDAAQTTIPFLDAQPVVSQVSVPLSGAGIYHKGQAGYGGFIAPKIITFNYAPYLIKPTSK